MIYADSWLYDRKIIYNELNEKGFIAKGYNIVFPDFDDAEDTHKDSFAEDIKNFLDNFDPSESLQFRFTVSHKFPEIENYRKTTESVSGRPFVSHVRNLVYRNMKNQENSKMLKRKVCNIFFTKNIEKNSSYFSFSAEKNRSRAENTACSQDAYFFQKQEQLKNSFGYTSQISEMVEEDYITAFAKTLCPSADTQKVIDNFSYEESVFNNLLQSNASFRLPGVKSSVYGFSFDSHVHSCLAMRQLPSVCIAEFIFIMTNLPISDYSITVNVNPIDIDKALDKGETQAKHLERDMDSTKHRRLGVTLDRVNQDIEEMERREDNFFDISYIIHVYDRDIDDLTKKTITIKDAVKSMRGARVWEEQERPTAFKLFLQTLPGWSVSSYNKFRLRISSGALARILPLSSSFTGLLKNAEALVYGNSGQVVGIRFFMDGEPLLAAMFGASRMGKSFNTVSFLIQGDPYFDYTAIIEEGNSYSCLMDVLGFRTTHFCMDGRQTVNPFDLDGFYLTDEHINFMTVFFANMCGKSTDNIFNRRVTSILKKYIMLTYESFIRSFSEDRPDIRRKAELMTYVIESYRKNISTENKPSSFLEAWIECRDILNRTVVNPEAYDFIKELTDVQSKAELDAFLLDENNVDLVHRVILSYFQRKQYPTLTDLLETISFSDEFNKPESTERTVHELLGSWEDSMFNGHSNVKFGNDYDHFELSELGEESDDIKALVIMLLQNIIRHNVLKRPRGSRKRIIFEECRRIFEVPGGVRLVKETFGQLGKYSTWPCLVTQQFSDGFNTDEAVTILGNTAQMFVMRQQSMKDLYALQKEKPISDITCRNIMNYPPPYVLPAEDKHSRFTYFQQHHPANLCGTCRNYAPPEVAFIATTTGKKYQKRAEQLKNSGNILETVIKLAYEEDNSDGED